MIQKKTLLSTRTSVKIYSSHANRPVPTNDEVCQGFITVANPSLNQVKALCAPDKLITDASSQRPNVASATSPTNATSSIHVGSQDTNLEVPQAPDTGTQFLPQTQVHRMPLAPVRLSGPSPGSKSIAATTPSPPMSIPMPMPSVSPPVPANARGFPTTATSYAMTQSPSPLPDHLSKPRATPEPLPQAPSTPSLTPGTNPSSKPIGATPITNSSLTTQPQPQPVSKDPKPAPKQNRTTKVNKPAQDAGGPTKSTKSSFSISTFTHVFKPLSSMPGAFPGPQMDVDWEVVENQGSAVQGGNWLKRLFRRLG